MHAAGDAANQIHMTKIDSGREREREFERERERELWIGMNCCIVFFWMFA